MPVDADWSFTTEPVGAADDGGVLVKTLALSLDPAMRGWMNEGKSYIAPVGIGEVMRAGGVGTVVASKSPAFAVGDTVYGTLGVQEYARFDAGQIAKRALHRIDLRVGTMTQWLNVLGMPGMTGYFGLLDVGQPQARRDRRRLRRGRRGRPDRRPAGEDQGLPRRRHRRRAGEVRVGGRASSASTPASTTRPDR